MLETTIRQRFEKYQEMADGLLKPCPDLSSVISQEQVKS
jgi:hypothetical protein